MVFKLEAVESTRDSVERTFEHIGFLLKEIREALDKKLDALLKQDFDRLVG